SSRKAGRSVVLDRIDWALSHLKLMGAVENSERGVWSISSHGRSLLTEGADAIVEASRKARLVRREARKQAVTDSNSDSTTSDLNEEENESWKSELLAILTSMPADAFERLCARLLREV